MTVCSMCGSAAGEFWQTRPARRVVLRRCPRPGDAKHIWVLCDECEEGLPSLNRSRKLPVRNGDPDPFYSSRTVRLTIGHFKDKSKGGDDSPNNLRAICDCCNEGLQNTSPMKPDRIHLLSQVRRATLDDQQALLDWLLRKFGTSKPTATPPADSEPEKSN